MYQKVVDTRSGTATAAGAGDVNIVFTTPFADTNYIVTLGNVGSSGAVVKSGSKVVGGIKLTFAAAGDCDWIAYHP